MSKPSENPRNLLMAHLAELFLSPFVTSGLLSGKWVPLGQCVIAAQAAYETGALLGHRFHDKKVIFVKLFCEPGRETDLVTHMGQVARDEIAACQGEGVTFFDLRWEKHVASTMEAMRRAGRTNLTETHSYYLIANEKIRYASVYRWLQSVTVQGVALGMWLPEVTEKLWRNSYAVAGGEEEAREWARWRSYGLNVPEVPPSPERLEDAQDRAVSYIVPYISHRWPEMLKELGL
jgi:predicted nucleic acid-binding protein